LYKLRYDIILQSARLIVQV